MAQRGMLPKIRKTAGGQPLARPTIRPVRAAKPPPPPTPPRKYPSGISPRGARSYDEEGPPTTAGIPDPSTMSAPGPRPTQVVFEDETQMRPVNHDLIVTSRDDETLAREAPPVTIPQPAREPDIYDSLPSLEARPPYDTYEAAFAERDPATQLRQAHEGSGPRERPRKYAAQLPAFEESQPSYHPRSLEDAPSYHPPPLRTAPPPAAEPAPQPAPEPAAPRVPPGFVVGVQPIRTQMSPANHGPLFPAHDAFAHAMPAQPPATVAYPPPATVPYQMAQHVPQHVPPPMYVQHPQHAPMMQAPPHVQRPPVMQTHPPMRALQPVGAQLRQPTSPWKTLRFAWFVFGVAFGIGFTFFASGVVPTLHKDEPAATFPPAPPVPTQSAAAAEAPPPPVQAPPPAPMPPPVTTAPPVASTPAPPPPPSVSAPAPAPEPPPSKTARASSEPSTSSSSSSSSRRSSPPKVAATRSHHSAPASAAPKPLPNSGSVEAGDGDDAPVAKAPAPAPAAAPASQPEIPKDLFSAALGP